MENRNEGDGLDLILTRVRRRMAMQYDAEDTLRVGELRGIPGIPDCNNRQGSIKQLCTKDVPLKGLQQVDQDTSLSHPRGGGREDH